MVISSRPKRSRAPSDSHSLSTDTHTHTAPEFTVEDLLYWGLRYYQQYKYKHMEGGRVGERGAALSRHTLDRCPKCGSMNWRFTNIKENETEGECLNCKAKWAIKY